MLGAVERCSAERVETMGENDVVTVTVGFCAAGFWLDFLLTLNETNISDKKPKTKRKFHLPTIHFSGASC